MFSQSVSTQVGGDEGVDGKENLDRGRGRERAERRWDVVFCGGLAFPSQVPHKNSPGPLECHSIRGTSSAVDDEDDEGLVGRR